MNRMKFKGFTWAFRSVLIFFLLSLLIESACKKETNTEKLGNLKGVIRNEFNQPLPGAIITIGSRSNTSKSDGKYQFEELPVGTCQVSVEMTSYLTQIQTVEIIENTYSQLDFVLDPGETTLELSKSNLIVTYQAFHEDINVTSNADWLVVESSEWIDCEPMEGSGNIKLRINWLTNTGDEKRIDSVFVRSGNLLKKINVTQGFPLKIVSCSGIIGNGALNITDSALVIYNKPVTVREIISEYEYCISEISYDLVMNGYGVKFTYGCAQLGDEFPFNIRVTDNEGINYNEEVIISYFDKKVDFEGFITDFVMTDDRKDCWVSTKNPDRIYYIPGDSMIIKRTFDLGFHPRKITINPYNQLLYVLGGDPDSYDLDSIVYVLNPANGNVVKEIGIMPDDFPGFSEYFPYSIGFTNSGYGVILLQSGNSSGIDWRIMDSANDDTVYFHKAHGYGNGQYPYFSRVYRNFDRSKILLTEMYGACEVAILDGSTHEINELVPGSLTRGVFITPNMNDNRIYFGQLYDQFIMDLEGNMSQISYIVNFGSTSADFCYREGKDNFIYFLNDEYLQLLDYDQSLTPMWCDVVYNLLDFTVSLDGKNAYARTESALMKFDADDFWKP